MHPVMHLYEQLKNDKTGIDAYFKSYDRSYSAIVYGAGGLLPSMLSKLEREGIKIACICDGDASKHGRLVNNRYPVISFEEAESKYPTAVYFIASTVYFDEIHSLLERKVSAERICSFLCFVHIGNTEFKEYFAKNTERFVKLYDLLSDDTSRDVLLKLIKAHHTSDIKLFASAFCGRKGYYFDSFLAPKSHSVYLDCGAYDGDTVVQFHEAATDGYSGIIAFEPMPELCKALLCTINEHNISKCKLVSKGVYDYDGTLQLLGVEGSEYTGIVSSIYAMIEIEIGVTTIDNTLDGAFCDIIKMDIEGAEMKALLGAEKTIKKHSPNLAICIYHRMEDFLEIPKLLLSMNPKYKLFLRHHSKLWHETVLYAKGE